MTLRDEEKAVNQSISTTRDRTFIGAIGGIVGIGVSLPLVFKEHVAWRVVHDWHEPIPWSYTNLEGDIFSRLACALILGGIAGGSLKQRPRTLFWLGLLIGVLINVLFLPPHRFR
jgi:hypothetical protein